MKAPWQLHLIAFLVVFTTLMAEALYMFSGTKATIPDVLLGRILGTLDAALLMVLSYYFTASIAQVRAPQRAADVLEPPKVPT